MNAANVIPQSILFNMRRIRKKFEFKINFQKKLNKKLVDSGALNVINENE